MESAGAVTFPVNGPKWTELKLGDTWVCSLGGGLRYTFEDGVAFMQRFRAMAEAECGCVIEMRGITFTDDGIRAFGVVVVEERSRLTKAAA